MVCLTGLQPGGLHSVFGVSHRAEQVKRHRLQVPPIPVKPLREIFDGLHGHLSQAKSVKEMTTSDERFPVEETNAMSLPTVSGAGRAGA